MKQNKLVIGLFGFGCVGKGLYDVLQQSPSLPAVIKTICIKHADKSRPIPASFFTTDKNSILNDPDIQIVVELTDDAEAAYELVKEALLRGKAVVSANKKMIAEHLDELLVLQQTHNTPFLYEAACCASIPIIRNLEEYYDTDILESIEGIVNGSTNYILTRLNEQGSSYPEALALAQQLGYAESDPLLDTGGFDARYKLVILIAHAFGVIARPEEIFHLGIHQIGAMEQCYAREKDMKIKLVAQAYKTSDGHVAAFVLPTFVRKTEKLYQVDDVYNGVITKTRFADTQFFVGKGAGALPTASAVLSDLSALRYSYRYEYKKLHAGLRLQEGNKIRLHIFLRHDLANGTPLKRFFSEINESYHHTHAGYIIGLISIQQLKQLCEVHGHHVWPILLAPVKQHVQGYSSLQPVTKQKYEDDTDRTATHPTEKLRRVISAPSG